MMRWSNLVRFTLRNSSNYSRSRRLQQPKRILEFEALETRLAPAVLA